MITKNFITSNTGATIITDFDGTMLEDGRDLWLLINDTQTTIDLSSSGLEASNRSTDYEADNGALIHFKYSTTDNQWHALNIPDEVATVSTDGLIRNDSGTVIAVELSGDVTTNGSNVVTIESGAVEPGMFSTTADDDGIEFIINGGGSVIATGEHGHLEVPWACTINSVTVLADQSGSIVVDIWVDSFANFPPTDADSITASAPPTLSTSQSSQDTTLTGWTTSLSKGDIIAYNVDSVTTVERVVISLKVDK